MPLTAFVAVVKIAGLVTVGAIRAEVLARELPPLPATHTNAGSEAQPLASVYQKRYEPVGMLLPPLQPDENTQVMFGVVPVSAPKLLPVFAALATLLSVLFVTVFVVHTVHPVVLLVALVPLLVVVQTIAGVAGRREGLAQFETR